MGVYETRVHAEPRAPVSKPAESPGEVGKSRTSVPWIDGHETVCSALWKGPLVEGAPQAAGSASRPFSLLSGFSVELAPHGLALALRPSLQWLPPAGHGSTHQCSWPGPAGTAALAGAHVKKAAHVVQVQTQQRVLLRSRPVPSRERRSPVLQRAPIPRLWERATSPVVATSTLGRHQANQVRGRATREIWVRVPGPVLFQALSQELFRNQEGGKDQGLTLAT